MGRQKNEKQPQEETVVNENVTEDEPTLSLDLTLPELTALGQKLRDAASGEVDDCPVHVTLMAREAAALGKFLTAFVESVTPSSLNPG